MMIIKKNRGIINKKEGITLIALVITIIVLLILAGVSISMLTGDNGILKRAQEAREKNEKATEEEQIQLAILASISFDTETISDDKIRSELKKNFNTIEDENIVGNETTGWEISINDKIYKISKDGSFHEMIWKKKEDGTIERVDGKITGLKIGDEIDYKCPMETYSEKWKLLGIDDNDQNLLLVSDENVDTLELSGTDGYYNGEKYLNTMCEKYADGKIAVNGRSLNVDDINKLTGYNPLNIGVYDPEQTGKGERDWKYGIARTFTKRDDGKIYATGENLPNEGRDTNYDNFYVLGSEVSLDVGESYTLDKSMTYSYYIPSLTTNRNDPEVEQSVRRNATIWNMLFDDTGLEEKWYWLASMYVGFDGEGQGVLWGLRRVQNDTVTCGASWGSMDGARSFTRGVRAVVSLRNDILLVKDSNYWSIK